MASARGRPLLLLLLVSSPLLGTSLAEAAPESSEVPDYSDYGDTPHCEPLQGEICEELGYDTTLFPNLLNHKNQESAMEELESLVPLIEIECSDVLREFLCSLYMPVCTNYGFHLPPCRALCTQARDDCEQALMDSGLKWPDKFNCVRFPEHHELMCVLSLNHSNFFTSFTPTPPVPTTSPHPWRAGPSVYPAGPSLTQCVSNADCIFERSVCRAGECVCEYPRTWGPYGCEETQILGGQCTTDNQCSTVTPNAVCIETRCRCMSPLTSYMNLACIHASGVGSLCYNDAQCRAVNRYSFCRYLVSQVVGTCACDPDQFIDIHGRCVPRLGGRCKKGTCPRQLGVASCQRGRESALKCFCRKKAVQRRGVCVLR